MTTTFISYARVNSDFTLRLATDLKAAGLDVWLDQLDIPAGARWDDEIEKALDKSKTFMIVLTPESIQSQNVKDEVGYAIDAGKLILPVVIKPCNVPFRLRRFQYVDFTNKAYEESLAEIHHILTNTGNLEQENPKEKPEPVKPISGKPPQKSEKTKFPRIDFQLRCGIVIAVIFFAILVLPRLFTFPVTQTPTATLAIPHPSETPEPSLTPTETFSPTPTPLPTEITDSKGVSMQQVPAGEFSMGSDNGELDEKPVHRVFLDTFYIDEFEVTNVLYKACVDAGGCQAPVEINSSTQSSYYGNPEFEHYPVVYVDWIMAKTYCEWREARLPSEAEWEKAARGTDGRIYPWGQGVDCSKANYLGCLADTARVGNYTVNVSPYGVHDMAGNVWEWVMDWYSDGYYSISPGSNPHGPEWGTYRVVRGGAWDFPGQYVSSTDRFWGTPQSAGANFGFRCARNIDFLPGSTPIAILNRDWQIYSQAGNNSIKNLSPEPETDYSFRVSFNFPKDGWGAVYKKISQNALVNSQGLIISYYGTGASNTLEVKLIFMDESLCKTAFPRKTATQPTVEWTIPYSSFSCSTKEGKPVSLSLDNLDRIDLSLSNRPDYGDVPGDGEIFVRKIQIVPLP